MTQNQTVSRRSNRDPRNSRFRMSSNPPPALDAVLRSLLAFSVIATKGELRAHVARINKAYNNKGTADDLYRFLKSEGFLYLQAGGRIEVRRGRIRGHLGVPEPTSVAPKTPIQEKVVPAVAETKVVTPPVELTETVGKSNALVRKSRLLFMTPSEFVDFEFFREGFLGDGPYSVPKAEKSTVALADRFAAGRLLKRVTGSDRFAVYEVIVPIEAWHIVKIEARKRRKISSYVYQMLVEMMDRAKGPYDSYEQLFDDVGSDWNVKFTTLRTQLTSFRDKGNKNAAIGGAIPVYHAGNRFEKDIVVCVHGFEGFEFEIEECVYHPRTHDLDARSARGVLDDPGVKGPVVEEPVVETPIVVAEDSTPTMDLERLLEDRPEVREALADEALAIADRIHSGEERTLTIAELTARRDALLAEATKLTETIAIREREVAEEKARLEAEEAELVAKLDDVRARKAKLE